MMNQALRQSAAYGMATILSRATLLVSLLVLPYLLTPRDYGALSMLVTVAALVIIVVPLEVSQGLARHYAPAPEREKMAYASSARAFLTLTLLAFLVLGQLLAKPLCVLILGDLAFLPAFRIALVQMALYCLFLFHQNQCRWEFRTAEYVLISLVYAFLNLALSLGLGFLIDPPLVGVVLGQLIGTGVAAGLGAYGLRRSFKWRIDRRKLRLMLAFSLPLVPASVALYANVYGSRLILNALATLDDVGLYTLAAQIGGIATLGMVGVQAAITPLVMANHHKPETPGQLARLFESFFGSSVVVCLLLGLFAPELIYYVGNPAYSGAGPLVLVLAPALLLAQMYVFAPGFAVAKRTLWQMWVSIGSAVLGLSSNFLLIPWLGIMGAAFATLVSGGSFLFLWFLFSQRLYPIPVRWTLIAVAAAGGIALGIAGQSLGDIGLVPGLFAKAGILGAAAALVVLIGLLPFRSILALLRAVALTPLQRR
jgi:O-antigen/teichoic acid export membrane protein